MALGHPSRPTACEYRTSSALLKSARRSAPTLGQDSTRGEYKTFNTKIVHNKIDNDHGNGSTFTNPNYSAAQ
jgi:hypothetical protein